MEKENKTKKALSTKEWILCIGAITILTLLMVLPPVFRIVFQEDTPNNTLAPTPTPTDLGDEPSTTETSPIDDSQYEKVICTKEETNSETYQELNTFSLAHENGQLKIYSSINKKTYQLSEESDHSSFLKEKTSCDEVPSVYLTIRGFNYDCTSSENEIQLTQKFDLSNFKEKRVTINQEEKLITTPYYLDQNVRVIRKDLEKQGYVCEEIQLVEVPTSTPSPSPSQSPVEEPEVTPTPEVTPDPTPTLLP